MNKNEFIKKYDVIKNSDDITLVNVAKKDLEDFKVDNAIIMAAGMSSRFAPLSYVKPKGLLNVRGEVLIERQIKQLHEAGIKDVTLVTGYLSDQFEYLKDLFGVDIVENKDYFKYNNTSSLILVLDKMKNTYICSSDNYFEKNPFKDYEYRSYYPVRESEFEFGEYYVTFDKDKLITDVHFDHGKYYMIGHVYFDNNTSSKFSEILKREYIRDEVKKMLWEKLYVEFLDDLDIYAKIDKYKNIHEFDTLDELKEFEPNYLENNNNQMLSNISEFFKVEENKITNFIDMRDGMTNLSFKFDVNGQSYVYRHPGVGTEDFISRKAEKVAQDIALSMKLDETYIYMDEVQGYKISHYLADCKVLDYHNKEHVRLALNQIKVLHDAKIKVDHDFDIWTKTLNMLSDIDEKEREIYPGFEDLYKTMEAVKKSTLAYSSKTYLCHCDFFNTNILFKNDKPYIIDWEYAGNDDPACDLGIFVASSDYTLDQAIALLDIYEGGVMEVSKRQHFVSYFALASYYCFIWAVYQESKGQPAGEFLNIWQDSANKYAAYVSKEDWDK